MKPGDLCVLGGRRTFKVGLVLGPARVTGKTRVKSFSTNAGSWSNAFALSDDLVTPLPSVELRTPRQRLVIKKAVLVSAAIRRDLRAAAFHQPHKQEA